ncbi:MAG TPA: hypothetical protein VFJ43_02070 [Bacteroidia bacterium]|nr:hypothetical protein [Bacteroidia bacterium]
MTSLNLPDSELKKMHGTSKGTAAFLKTAFCIDGECKQISADPINGIKFSLIDSKRGKFFVTISTK